MNNEIVSIIIPTYNNMSQLHGAILSLMEARGGENLMHIYVVNNGDPQSCDWIDPEHKFITVIQSGGNKGWEGGLLLGLEQSKGKYVMFLNDDIIVPYACKYWLSTMLQHFKDPLVAAVGPASNMVMGLQNMLARTDIQVFTSKFLIGFCMLVDREKLAEVGGVDETLPGGDDLDLSIRFRDKGYKLIVDKNVFVFHYGQQTGIRLYGNHTVTGGWNSFEFSERTNFALIKKHGFAKWWDMTKGTTTLDSVEYSFKKDQEGDLIREHIDATDKKVIDIACGDLKTFPNAIGLDIVPKDEFIAQIGGDAKSQADIACDVSQPLPIEDDSVDIAVARHILEHMINPISAVRNWIKPLKVGGKLIISVPNEYLIKSIPMNPEHVHAWTLEYMIDFIKSIGNLKLIEMWDSENTISFTSVMEKI